MDQSKIMYPDQLIPAGHLYHNRKTDRIEALIPTKYKTNHAAHLFEAENGDLLCVWFAGSEEGAADIRIVMSRLKSNSVQWSEPVEVANDAERAEQNPSLFQAPGGEIWLLYTSMATRGCTLEQWQQQLEAGISEGPFAMQHTSVIMRRVSRDFGYSWGDPEALFTTPGSFCRQPIQILHNGNWIFGNWRSRDASSGFGNDRTFFQLSEDEGSAWRCIEVPGSEGRVHANVVELDENRLAAFFRSRSADYIYVSHSEDAGRNWLVPTRTELPNNNASIAAIKLQSGKIAIIYNDIRMNDDSEISLWPYERYPVTIALSEDGGCTWPYRRHVHSGDGYCGEKNRTSNRRFEYPCLMQSADGLIHAAFSSESRVFIEYACFTEQWIIGKDKPEWPWQNFPLR